jgi:hypothetical protein
MYDCFSCLCYRLNHRFCKLCFLSSCLPAADRHFGLSALRVGFSRSFVDTREKERSPNGIPVMNFQIPWKHTFHSNVDVLVFIQCRPTRMTCNIRHGIRALLSAEEREPRLGKPNTCLFSLGRDWKGRPDSYFAGRITCIFCGEWSGRGWILLPLLREGHQIILEIGNDE